MQGHNLHASDCYRDVQARGTRPVGRSRLRKPSRPERGLRLWNMISHSLSRPQRRVPQLQQSRLQLASKLLIMQQPMRAAAKQCASLQAAHTVA